MFFVWKGSITNKTFLIFRTHESQFLIIKKDDCFILRLHLKQILQRNLFLISIKILHRCDSMTIKLFMFFLDQKPISMIFVFIV